MKDKTTKDDWRSCLEAIARNDGNAPLAIDWLVERLQWLQVAVKRGHRQGLYRRNGKVDTGKTVDLGIRVMHSGKFSVRVYDTFLKKGVYVGRYETLLDARVARDAKIDELYGPAATPARKRWAALDQL